MTQRASTINNRTHTQKNIKIFFLPKNWLGKIPAKILKFISGKMGFFEKIILQENYKSFSGTHFLRRKFEILI